jgi:hypothetical protein
MNISLKDLTKNPISYNWGIWGQTGLWTLGSSHERATFEGDRRPRRKGNLFKVKENLEGRLCEEKGAGLTILEPHWMTR